MLVLFLNCEGLNERLSTVIDEYAAEKRFANSSCPPVLE